MNEQEIIAFLSEHLSIHVDKGGDGDYYSSRGSRVEITLKLKGEVISSEGFYFTEGESSSSY